MGKMDYINKERLFESLNDVKGLIEENNKLKGERDNALMSLLLIFISQPEKQVFLPQFDNDLIPDIIDYFKVHANPSMGYYVGGKAQSSFTVAIKDCTQNGYFISRTPDEVLEKLNKLIASYTYGLSEEYIHQLIRTESGVELAKVKTESEVSND